jgi:hypothetical protein
MADTPPAATSTVTTAEPPSSSTPWMTACKYAMGGFVVISLFYLVLAGKVPATDYELLVVVPILGALGIHQARQAGADVATKAVAAVQAAPNPTPPSP